MEEHLEYWSAGVLGRNRIKVFRHSITAILQYSTSWIPGSLSGSITHRLSVSTKPYACMLGGPDRRTLFVCTAQSSNQNEIRLKPGGKIETVEVEVSGAGRP